MSEALAQQNTYTEEDYYNLPENIHAELIDGQFYLMSAPSSVFCKYFLKKIAKYFWRKLHFQIGESCKASAGNYSASHIAAIADRIQLL